MTRKFQNNITGVAGEYFVAGELSKRGFVASITLKNTQGIDIVATNTDASKSIGIQVKTSRRSGGGWMLNKKAEDFYSKNLFYVFVNLKEENERPDFYIVPSKVVVTTVKRSHEVWLKTPGRKGQPHKDSPARKFFDKEKKYLERWDMLGL